VATYSLLQWVLDGKHVGNGYGFPFDRPLASFTNRIKEALLKIEEMKRLFADNDHKYNKPLYKAAVDMRKITEDRPLLLALAAAESRINVFDELRQAMRIALPEGSNGLNDNGSNEPVGEIESRVGAFRDKIVKDPALNGVPEYGKMIEQIDKYWNRLFADPVSINTQDGVISIQPQRTNNLMEQFFRSIRRAHRRRTGDNSMKSKLKAMATNTVLVKNLENQQYMDILLNGKSSLEELFAGIKVEDARKEMSGNNESQERIPTQVKRMIKLVDFPEKMLLSLKMLLA